MHQQSNTEQFYLPLLVITKLNQFSFAFIASQQKNLTFQIVMD